MRSTYLNRTTCSGPLDSIWCCNGAKQEASEIAVKDDVGSCRVQQHGRGERWSTRLWRTCAACSERYERVRSLGVPVGGETPSRNITGGAVERLLLMLSHEFDRGKEPWSQRATRSKSVLCVRVSVSISDGKYTKAMHNEAQRRCKQRPVFAGISGRPRYHMLEINKRATCH